MQRSNAALDWLRGSSSGNKWRTNGSTPKEILEELSSDKFHPSKYNNSLSKNGFHSLEEEVMYLRSLRMGDGTSNGSSSKHSDSMSDSGLHVPYEVLLQDLTNAKRQLLELRSLVSFEAWRLHNSNSISVSNEQNWSF